MSAVNTVLLSGTTLLAGPPKIGKSRLTLDMAMYEGLAILVVCHDLISGASGLPGSVDGFMVMQRKRGQEDARLKVTHRPNRG